MTEVSPVEYCPLAELPSRGLRQFIKAGRFCKIDKTICFNWDKPELHKDCPIKNGSIRWR